MSIGTESSVLALGSEVLVTEIAGEAVRDLAHGLNATRNSDLKMITRSHGIAGSVRVQRCFQEVVSHRQVATIACT